ncbi:MAG: 2-oxo acid dehydrogenase subunit E2 [Spirochaetales bacterium]|nr:2-oxo acid dehydrogenase subunit E2 [Spirochaetales bacterium]
MAQYVQMIALSPTMEEGTIQKWNVKTGDKIESGTVLCEVETDKATMDYESTDEGTLLAILVKEGGSAKIGDPIAIIGKEGEDISSLKKPEQKPVEKKTGIKPEKAEEPEGFKPGIAPPRTKGRIRISPLARKLAGNYGIDPEKIPGSGPGGRIIKRDIVKYAAGTKGQGEIPAVKYQPDVLKDEVIVLNRNRKIAAQKLSESKFTAPHYYLRLSVASDGLLAFREKINSEAGNVKISLNAFLIKLAAESLKRHPVVNSSWDNDRIIRHGSIDIGLAVALEDGLIVPVVRDCGNKGVYQIDEELRAMIARARENKLSLDEITGATFTISNLGSFGIDEFTAIINPPGSAILAVGRIIREAVVDEQDKIGIQKTIRFTLSCDHRVINGAEGARFMQTFKNNLESPYHVLL